MQEGLEAPPAEEGLGLEEVDFGPAEAWAGGGGGGGGGGSVIRDDDDDDDEDLSLAAVFRKQTLGGNDAIVSPPPKPTRHDALEVAQVSGGEQWRGAHNAE